MRQAQTEFEKALDLLRWALRRLEDLDAEHMGEDDVCTAIRKFLGGN